MFFLILASVLGLMHLYVWKRVVKDTTRPGRVRRWASLVLVGLLALLVAALVVPRTAGVTGFRWLAWPGYLWFGVVAYLFLTLLALEPVRLLRALWRRGRRSEEPESVQRRIFLSRVAAVTAGAATVGLVGTGLTNALGPPQILRVPVRLPRLDPAFDGFRIAVVSDIHLGPLLGRAHTERIVAMINETEPDLVAVVGDVVDGTVAELGSAAAPLQDLVAREGAFFITGNHEYFVEDTDEWLRELDRLGLQPLRNENTRIRRGAGGFDLVGINDLAGESRSDPPDLDRALRGIQRGSPTVLLAHQPVQVGEAAERGVDLQISGHTHGGQMWPFHYAVDLAQPALAGLSRVRDTQLYVTRGAGFWGPPLRVGAPPDISVLTLRSP
ncbi:metallophosphatase [Mycolicibacterium duvalii]|uniref:Metallophosphatase n=1 Tax=Mycolicibacterium duvalii TaxID=39688 RepID=A0A7I7K2R8_9MYCO|nr:metallophosphoesterase [Mycolicibacterium duvalii]MCV7367105.1 metallophosphoesterase [Mycolicibacterium duvalii]PEG42867.1 metallophosphatase [Mycolicibacterium duvalii]BBX18345.1 metallophosphatase [Mycolicibacterium duvalii]